MRIPTLLQKLAELSAQPERRSAIDVDLMLDYTRVLYADLLEWRSRLPAPGLPQTQKPVVEEPTVAVLADTTLPQHTTAKQVAPPPQPAPIQDERPKTEPHTERDIRALIGINDKYQIMSELFGNDKGAYEKALDFINRCQSENMAMNWLREQLWITEERSDAAQSFFEIVNRFFRK